MKRPNLILLQRSLKKMSVIFISISTIILITRYGHNTAKKTYVTTPSPEERYITASFRACDGGLGNKLWRLASLYAIGRRLGRKPFIHAVHDCWQEGMSEVDKIFPRISKTTNIFDVPLEELTFVDYANNCCRYGPVEKLESLRGQFLVISGSYLQSFKYFQGYEQEIQRLFQFSEELRKEVRIIKNNIFEEEDSGYKLCVHTRSFNLHELSEFRVEFSIKAINYLANKLEASKKSLVLFGTDMVFLRNISNNIEPFKFHQTAIISNLTRLEDFVLAVEYCDSFLLTASGSTFAWWIGYLMTIGASGSTGISSSPTNKQVYFNGQASKSGFYSKDIYDEDIFLSEWTRLMLDYSDGRIYEEKRSTLERPRENITAKRRIF